MLKAPTLNFEISAAVAEVVQSRDKNIQTRQDQLGQSIASKLFPCGNTAVNSWFDYLCVLI